MTYTKPGQITSESGIMFRRLVWNACIWLLRPSCEGLNKRGRE